ncbi:heptaprenyl diphosphate synthase component I [Planococcus antarcticus DSM 14505]|uniref:Heptaprenyl diphosphate synthase n=1 Tax=Planococcus antarcticus DSM 14505 TaxID=1185653 RepID=A0A1C7DGU9_9BACL|nr:heptaprenyl diphosphate synthase component 1 [Planococcus antarcticus]ANU10664.1 heptaprenyl diphosphate synthase [Planococcus antarcticus DSM 14505]EIM06751.1 heptaprenyl diphosphate synthase component I [Planococcus antarcticus DSM 14505]
MKGHQIQSKIISMEVEVLNAVQQRTLDQFTEGPSIKESRLFFLLLPFFDGKNWSAEIESSAKTVSIVYAALHAHDKIKEDVPIIKEQQLTVLAGDLYSGIYYQMLVNSKNIAMVQQLASAIIQVSEKKTSFFEEAIRPLDEIEEAIIIIETELLLSYYRFYGFSEYTLLAEQTLLYLRYAEELEYLQSKHYTNFLRELNSNLAHEIYTEHWLLEKLDSLHGQILVSIADCSLDYELAQFLLHQITPHQHRAEQLTREG